MCSLVQSLGTHQPEVLVFAVLMLRGEVVDIQEQRLTITKAGAESSSESTDLRTRARTTSDWAVLHCINPP